MLIRRRPQRRQKIYVISSSLHLVIGLLPVRFSSDYCWKKDRYLGIYSDKPWNLQKSIPRYRCGDARNYSEFYSTARDKWNIIIHKVRYWCGDWSGTLAFLWEVETSASRHSMILLDDDDSFQSYIALEIILGNILATFNFIIAAWRYKGRKYVGWSRVLRNS